MAIYLPVIISWIVANTMLAVMVKDTQLFKAKFYHTLYGKIIMLIPPVAFVIVMGWAFIGIFQKFRTYFKEDKQ